VVLLIGLSLIKVGIISCGGGYTAMDNGTFASWENLSIAGAVLLSVLYSCNHIYEPDGNERRHIKIESVFKRLGNIETHQHLYIQSTHIYFSQNKSKAVSQTESQHNGTHAQILILEATGDVTANSMISGLKIEGDDYLKRVSGGVMADGFNSFLAGIFNSFPNSIFAQNNGIIQLTGVASRYVGYYIAAMLILLGLFPIVGAVFSLMPDPVLGGATLLMFGTVAAAGIRIVASQNIGRKETLVLAVSLSLGLGVELMPDVLSQAPEAIRSIFSSGITTGGLTAIIANIVIRVKEENEE